MNTINMLLNYSLVFFVVLLLQQAQVFASTRPWKSSLSSTMVAKPRCRDKCGNLTIPYPFGIGKGCYFDKPFEITCNETTNNSSASYAWIAPTPWYTSPIYYISMDTIRTGGDLFVVPYNKSSGKSIEGDEPISGSSTVGQFSLSATGNKFIVVGCDIYAYIKDSKNGEIVSGCASFCTNNTSISNFASSTSSCTGNNGCCQSSISRIPEEHTYSIQTMNTMNTSWAFNNCSYFLIAYSGYFKYITQLLSNNSSNCEDQPAAVGEVVVEWVIGNVSCEKAIKSPKSYACRENSDCVNSTNGYRCRCSNGYQGNPYLSNGCQDINECARSRCPHHTSCVNTPGSFYCEPNNERHMFVLQLCLGIASAVIFIVLIAGCLLLHRQMKKRKEKQAKQKYFKRNGGLLLQKRISISEGSCSTLLHMKLFKKEELEKATDNFNESRILGKGGLGTVYKGMLSNGSIVAIKKSNVVDENQVGQFVNEIFILSQINHRHIVKVLGCCLETQVPLLVYEYICNGTLSHHLHKSCGPIILSDSRVLKFTLSLEHRLRIAKEIAGALSYLHSYASTAIFHRDIKSSNILLDENYKAVVSDFGISRLIPLEKTHLTTQVGGTFGYFDPEYFQSGQLNDKSDVYAFGVVLLELLTSQRAVSSDALSSQSLVMLFRSMFKQGRLLEIVDPEIAREDGQKMVPTLATLAKRCLKSNASSRPSMKEVAAELDELRTTRYDMPHADSFKDNISLESEGLIEDS